MTHLPIPNADTVGALRARLKNWRADGQSIGFVPTMGALHDGHLSLVKRAKAQCDRVVTSIFVNPAQFAPHEDFDAYPRTFVEDADKLERVGCDLIFSPRRQVMYPEGFATTVSLTGPAEGLEAAARPHFFNGVATVVAKLLNQVRPDIAVFGEKDYQQLLVIKQLNADLDLGVEIMGGPIVRERDGLAMSSRNRYLSEAERKRAGQLHAILAEGVRLLEGGMARIAAEASTLKMAEGAFDGVDYIEARCARTLAVLPEGAIDRPARILGAVRLGETRLIDNLPAAPQG